MDFKLEFSRNNVDFELLDLFPKQQLDYDIEFYDTIEIDKVKIPFYTDLRIPLTTHNKSADLFNFEPFTDQGADYPKDDFYFRLTILGSSNTIIRGILNISSIEYNSGEPYAQVVLKDFISKYLADIKDVNLGDIYTDSYYTTRHTVNDFRLPTSSGGEAGIIGDNPGPSRPISFPYVDFVNDVKGKFNYAARQFMEYGTGIGRTGIMPVFSVSGFLEYLGRYISSSNLPVRLDSNLFGVGFFNGNPLIPSMQPEKLTMVIPSQLLAKQDTNTRFFNVQQSPAWAGTNTSLNSGEDYDGNAMLITTQWFGNMETSGNYGTDAEGNPLYVYQAWGKEKTTGFYPDDVDEGIRGFFAPKVSFNSSISFRSGDAFCIWENPELEIPVVQNDKLVSRIYNASANSTMTFAPYIGVYEDGLMVKKMRMQDVSGNDITLTLSGSSVKQGYSNKNSTTGPFDYLKVLTNPKGVILGAATSFSDVIVFETFTGYLPEEELFINGGSRYSINYFIEPLDGELEISYANGYTTTIFEPETATGLTIDTFGVNELKKLITRLGTPDGASGTYGTLSLEFTANEDVLLHKLTDEFIIQDSIKKTCPFTVHQVLLNIAKRFDCGLFYDYDDSDPDPGNHTHVLRIDPLFAMRGTPQDVNQYIDDIKSYKISTGGDKVKTLTLNNKNYGLYYDDLNNDDVTIGSTTQEINDKGIAEITVNLDSSIYHYSVCGEESYEAEGNQNFQNGAFSEYELGFTPNIFTKNADTGFRFAYLDKPLYATFLLRPDVVLKGQRSDDKMITEVERTYIRSELGNHVFNGRLFSFNTAGWSLMFEAEDGNPEDMYNDIWVESEKIKQSELPKIEFNMVVPTTDLTDLNFFLSGFTASLMTGGTIYVRSAKGEVFEDYAYLTIEALLS